jgi:hypothetical protein
VTSLLTSAREYKRDAKTVLVRYHHLKLIRDPRHQITVTSVKLKVGGEEARWQQGIGNLSNHWADVMLRAAGPAITYALAHWKVTKNEGPPAIPPDEQEVLSLIVAGLSEETMVAGGLTTYLGLALGTSEVSGQQALLKMGLGRTFAWAHPQNMARDLFQVRGSKVVQNMYGNHLDQLTKMIIDATNPRYPKTISQVSSGIKEQWPDLRAYQVTRIARTETATIWTDTQLNAYKANGVAMCNSILATGPSIPGSPDYNPEAQIQTSDPCDECVSYAADGPYPIDEVDLPQHPNCFPAGTRVGGPPATGSFKRWYEGEMVDLTTRAGNRLSVTPNHPILTTEGWIKASELIDGDELICTDLMQTVAAIQPGVGSVHDVDEVPALIEDVVDAISGSDLVAASSVPVTAAHFHGDGTEGQIAVVASYGAFQGQFYPSVEEPTLHKQSRGGGVQSSQLPRPRSALTLFIRSLHTPHNLMRRSNLGRALFGGHAKPSRGVGFVPVSEFDTRIAQHTTDRVGCRAKIICEATRTFPGTVTTDEIVKIRRYPFSGHVYNLETQEGLYTANNVIVHNCRCEVIPVLEDENGNPWLPPDQPWTGDAIGSLDSSGLPGESDVQAALTPNVFGYRPVVRIPGARRRR